VTCEVRHRSAKDAHKPFNGFCHAEALLSPHSHPGRRNERQTLYWRSKRNLNDFIRSSDVFDGRRRFSTR
jgi:hypothetical protein